MRTETLIAKLKEKGYAFPTCLQWTHQDVDARFLALNMEKEIPLMDKEDKMMLLNDFFNENEDGICEFINQQLEEYILTSTRNDLSSQPF